MWRSMGVIAVLGIALVWMAVGSTAGGPAQPGADASQRAQVGEQVEAFRRLVYITLRESLEPAEARGRATNFWQSAVGQVSATYLPGYGLCVSAELRTAARPRASGAEGGSPELWEQLSRDVAAGRSAGEGYFAQVTPHCNECSSGAVVSLAAAADAIVRTLAEHGRRLSSLESEDRVTVALRLTPRADTLSHMAHSMESMRGNSRGGGQRQRQTTETPREQSSVVANASPAAKADLVAVPPQIGGLSAAVKEGTGPTNILITFRVRDLLKFHEKPTSLGDFAKSAEVTDY